MSARSDRYVQKDDVLGEGPELGEDVRVSYAAALYYFARIGGVGEEEERTVEQLAHRLGIDGATLEIARKAGLDKDRLRGLLERIDGAFIVRDALRIAHADGVFEDAERRVVDKLAEATGLSPARLAWIHVWVQRERALRSEWNAILAADSRGHASSAGPAGARRAPD